MTRAPDLVEPLLAFRSWRVLAGELWSPYLPEKWADGMATARCIAGEPGQFRHAAELLAGDHDSPHPDCRCGIHAYFAPRSALAGVDFRRVLGIVAVWGAVELHPEGLRAQHAQVRALGVAAGWSSWHRADVAAIAEHLGVPLLPENVLGAAAEEFGSVAPPRLPAPHPA